MEKSLSLSWELSFYITALQGSDFINMLVWSPVQKARNLLWSVEANFYLQKANINNGK
jgi:hypothetical protein